MCSFRSAFALKSQLLQDFQNALPQLATFVSKVSKNFADTYRSRFSAPQFVLWCFVSVLFPTVVDQVSLTGTAKHPYIDLGSGPAGSNAITQSTHQLEGTPHKNLKKQDFPKDKSNQFLLSAELLMCSLHSWFPKKNRLSPRFPKRIASADHFLSPKSPAFCNNGRCRHVLSCGPRFERFYCFGESSCTLLAVLRTRLQSVFVAW